MNCPKCAAAMEKVTYQGIEVDRCTSCKGLWFDEFEKEELKKFKDSENIDTGDLKVGKRLNQIDRIPCPKCGGLMMRMVELNQSHIWFEHCTVCRGSFFDAGEFKDLKQQTIWDFFKDLVTPARRQKPAVRSRRQPKR